MKGLVLNNCKAKLFISKGEGGYTASLSIGGQIINERGQNDYKGIEFEQYEGQSLDVTINGKDVLLNNEIIATLSNVLDEGTLVYLGYVKKKNAAVMYLKDDDGKPVILAELKLSELPEGLFDRLKGFRVYVINDDTWRIIRYANLHQHTEYSLLDGITRVNDLAKKTEWACAITDHGNMHGFNHFGKAMKKYHRKPIYGCEVYVETIGGEPRKVLSAPVTEDDEDERMFDNERSPKSTLAGEHLILLAETNQGLINLFRLVTESSVHFYRKPHVTWEMLEKYHEGIIATSACIAGTLGRSVKEMLKAKKNPEVEKVLEGGLEEALLSERAREVLGVYRQNEKIADMYCTKMIELFGKDNFFIELQNHHFPLEDEIMQVVREYADKYGLKKTVGIDAHYLNKEDAEVHELWLCQQTGKTIDDPKRMRFSGDGYYVHTSDEVVELFKNDLDALDNTLVIAERCNAGIESEGYHLPKFPLPEGYESEKDYLRHLCREGFRNLFPRFESAKQKKIYTDRMLSELKVIEDMGFESYFLVVSDFCAYARDTEVKDHIDRYFPKNHYDQSKIPENILKDFEVYVGTGRGSAAGSLVAYCLGITKVDPIKYDLLFER